MSFRIRSRNIQLVPSGSQRRLEKRYLHFRVHAAARWLLFWSPPAAYGAVGRTEAASLSANSRSSVSIYRRLHRRWLSLGTRKASCRWDSRVTKRCVLDDRPPYANNHKSDAGGIQPLRLVATECLSLNGCFHVPNLGHGSYSTKRQMQLTRVESQSSEFQSKRMSPAGFKLLVQAD